MPLDEGTGQTEPDTSRSAAAREHALGLQSALSRIVATGGIVGIGTGVAGIMGSQDVTAWIIGLVVACLSVVLAAIVWSSRGY
jgi:hypothetical protein